MKFARLLLPLLTASTLLGAARAEQLRIYTTPALGQFLAAAVPGLREASVDAIVSGEASSSNAIQLLAAGQADAVLTVRGLTGEDRALAPDKAFHEVRIGTQATAMLISRDVWQAGIRSVNRDQLRQIYERDFTNWKQLGGPDRPIKFFSYGHGQGVWEHFAQWLYGEIRRAPLGNFEAMISAEDVRTAIEFNGGSIAIGSALWKDDKEVFALAISEGNGPAITPNLDQVINHTYPLSRPLMIVFGDRPTGPRGRLRDYFLSREAQALLQDRGFIPVRSSAP